MGNLQETLGPIDMARYHQETSARHLKAGERTLKEADERLLTIGVGVEAWLEKQEQEAVVWNYITDKGKTFNLNILHYKASTPIGEKHFLIWKKYQLCVIECEVIDDELSPKLGSTKFDFYASTHTFSSEEKRFSEIDADEMRRNNAWIDFRPYIDAWCLLPGNSDYRHAEEHDYYGYGYENNLVKIDEKGNHIYAQKSPKIKRNPDREKSVDPIKKGEEILSLLNSATLVGLDQKVSGPSSL